MGGGKLKKRNGDSGKKIAISKDNTQNPDINHPVFCLRYLNKDYHLDKCTNDEKVSLITRIQKLSQLSWNEIQLAAKHGFGSEKIPQEAIKGAAIPSHLSKDEVLYALRFDGKKPMVGYRDRFVFHIIYLDRDFTLYNH